MVVIAYILRIKELCHVYIKLLLSVKGRMARVEEKGDEYFLRIYSIRRRRKLSRNFFLSHNVDPTKYADGLIKPDDFLNHHLLHPLFTCYKKELNFGEKLLQPGTNIETLEGII